MTAFELRTLALIGKVLFKEISGKGKLTNRHFRVKRVNGEKIMLLYAREVSRDSIDVEDTEARVKIYSHQPKPGTLLTLKSEERTYNELMIEEIQDPYIRGRDNYGRFEIRVDSHSRTRAKDVSDNSEYEYEIS